MPIQQKPLVVPKINLMPKDPFYDTLIGKIMVWAIQVGRYIIVFTEIIVIMSFASRFKLDRDLTDLTGQVTQKKAIVQSFGDVESRTRAIQEKISTVEKLVSDTNAVFYLDRVTARIPAGIELTQLTYEPTFLNFSGKASSSNILAGLIVALQQEKAFAAVSVDRISSGDANDPSVQFAIKLALPRSETEPVATDSEQPKPDTQTTPEIAP